MIRKFILVLYIAAITVNQSTSFWSLDSDLQLGYEIGDLSYDIIAVIEAILQISSRPNIILSDAKTIAAASALTHIGNQLRAIPSQFFTELAAAASSRLNNEEWHIERLRKHHATYMRQLEILSNATGPLDGLKEITNPSIISTLSGALNRVFVDSRNLLNGAEKVTFSVAQIRANSTLLLTPALIDNFIAPSTSQHLRTTLIRLLSSYAQFFSSLKDAIRLTVAHGSMNDILQRSFTKDINTRNLSLYNFLDSYNKVKSTLVTSLVSFRQTAHTGFTSFIRTIQATYDDTIVRPRFDREQLPLIVAFVDILTSKVYNQTLFEASFDIMRDKIVKVFTFETDKLFSNDLQQRDAILNLLKHSFVRNYASCLNKLVAEAQSGRNSLTAKYTFCLDERTSSVTVVVPSTSSWLSVIRDNVNFILQQLNGCINGQTSVAGRKAASDCIQLNVNNLEFYATYLPATVELNLRPIVTSPPVIFKNCVDAIESNERSEKFDEIYEDCKREGEGGEISSTSTIPEVSSTSSMITLTDTTASSLYTTETHSDLSTTTEITESTTYDHTLITTTEETTFSPHSESSTLSSDHETTSSPTSDSETEDQDSSEPSAETYKIVVEVQLPDSSSEELSASDNIEE